MVSLLPLLDRLDFELPDDPDLLLLNVLGVLGRLDFELPDGSDLLLVNALADSLFLE